jgi:hypothetical protein
MDFRSPGTSRGQRISNLLVDREADDMLSRHSALRGLQADADILSDDMMDLHTYGKVFETLWVTVHDTAIDGNTPFDANALAKAKGGATPLKRPENGPGLRLPVRRDQGLLESGQPAGSLSRRAVTHRGRSTPACSARPVSTTKATTRLPAFTSRTAIRAFTASSATGSRSRSTRRPLAGLLYAPARRQRDVRTSSRLEVPPDLGRSYPR